MERRPVTEIGVSALIILICAVVFWRAWGLPPGTFEPMGSGPVPMWTSAIVILCCLIVIAGAVRALIRGPGWDAAVTAEFRGGRPAGALWLIGLTVIYALTLEYRLTSFGLLTAVYLFLLIWALERFAKKKLLPALLVAAITGFGAEYLFTQVFVVDLPV